MDLDDEHYDELVDDDDDDVMDNEEQHLNKHRLATIDEHDQYSSDVDCQQQFGESIRPTCLVCGRTQLDNVRLFRWPRENLTRFGCDAELNDATTLDHCFICSFHFDADQFLYSDEKIYWAPNAYPHYRLRRPSTVAPFPWEIGINRDEQHQLTTTNRRRRERKRTKLPPPSVTRVHFRQSKFRIAGKKRHAVAIVNLPTQSDQFYEFSYNRTSSIDGTKFYSCLQCRKAKLETKVKDRIRTIHLDRERVLSRGDPISGHHFSCRPVSEANRERDLRLKQEQQRLKKQAKQHPSSSLPTANRCVLPVGASMNETDQSTSWTCDRTVAQDDMRHISISFAPVSVAQPPAPRIRPLVPTHVLPSIRYRLTYSRPLPIQHLQPRCYLCKLVVDGGAEQMIEHLQMHIEKATKCQWCGVNAAFSRRLMCEQCAKRSQMPSCGETTASANEQLIIVD